ncbi:MAG: TonB-dependent receptor [Undibacterium sp.]|nr:TonB-dependent receptor [Undibacterium sp.]
MTNQKRYFKKTLIAHALVVAFGVGVATFGGMQAAYAQSSATGTIYGKVDAPAGASISILNTDTGLKRSVSLDSAGRYTVTALPAGHYKVEMHRDGKVAGTQDFDIVIGQGIEASFTASSTQQVTVSATRTRIDVSNTNNGAVFTSKDLARLPIQTNLTAIALLAPNTTRGDAAYGNVASFGGGGVSENAYYVNGFPVTNPLSQLGSSQLPWGSVQQTSVITGGFGAEFGRSIGGVMNLTTKSGTNNWEAGVSYSITPNTLRSKRMDIYYPYNGHVSAPDGKIRFRNSSREDSVTQYGVTLGGPIIADKLFMFAAVENNITDTGVVLGDLVTSNTLKKNGRGKTHTQTMRFLTKFDWNITDDHRLELTSIGDKTKSVVGTYGYFRDTDTHNNVKYTETTSTNPAALAGAQTHMLKYTGQITDALTLTAMGGQLKAPRGVTYFGSDPNNSTIHSVASTVDGRQPDLDKLGLYSVNANPYGGSLSRPGDDKVNSLRFDVEYKLGSHTLRAGIDRNDLISGNVGVKSSGNGVWTYQKVDGDPTKPAELSNGRQGIVANYGGYGKDGYYVTEFFFNSLTGAKSSQTAQYIEDRYQVTKNLLLVGGLRMDQYSNANGDGETFIDMKNQLAPRLSASWDVNGDSSMKVFGSVGRYYLQLPTQVAARAASRSSFMNQDFTYSGIDSNGQPTGLKAINLASSPDGESGTRKDPRSIAARDLKPNFQDEITMGFEKAVNPALNLGLKFTYRTLGAGIDDTCDTRLIAAYSQKAGLTQAGVPRDYLSCWIFNPGEASTIWIESHDALGEPTGNGRYVTFSAAEMGYPKAERKYTAIDVFAEHPLRNSWYGKVNYTWSRSKGNMEGQTNSDTGQSDVAITSNWDFPEFMTFANGHLPNDRTHQLKAFGFYEFNPEWSLGANMLIQSGRPKVCRGVDLISEHGENPNYPIGVEWGGPGYGTAYMFCNGVPAPRGSLGRMPAEKRLDLSLTYKPNYLKGLVVGVDMFNVLNDQTILTRNETYGSSNGKIGTAYGGVRQYADPLTVKLRVEYNRRF